MDNEIKGIICEVKNCKYHGQSNNCNAGLIKVRDTTATSVADTACQTFACCDNNECGI